MNTKKATFSNDELQEVINGFDSFDEDEMRSTLAQYGATISFCDSGIDDGCDDDSEDEYVMYSSCDITDCQGEERSFKVYYGNNTLEIGWIKEN